MFAQKYSYLIIQTLFKQNDVIFSYYFPRVMFPKITSNADVMLPEIRLNFENYISFFIKKKYIYRVYKKKVNNYKMAYKSNMQLNFRRMFYEYGYFKVF